MLPEPHSFAFGAHTRAQIFEKVVVSVAMFYIQALESNEGAYEKLKEIAKRIERRNLTFQSVRGGAAKSRRPVRLKKEAHSLNESKQHELEAKPTKPRKRETRCFNCQETGHLARECSKKAKSTTNPRTVGSLSARLSAASAHIVGMTMTQELQGVQPLASPLFEGKTMVQLGIFGRVWPGLLDTGSEISILPAKVLLQAKADGLDIDNEVAEYPIDNAKRVYDASGSRMSFITIVDVNIRERDGTCDVMSKMYVSRSDEYWVIIGSNVLPRLGYQLVRETEGKGEHRLSPPANEPPPKPKTKDRPKERRGVRVGSVSVARTLTATSDNKFPHFRADREFDVVDEMNCLHAKFRCQGQKLPILDGVPQIDLSACNCSSRLIAGDMIPELPQPAHSHRVECVLD
ncbi:hypothetical protein Y032_0557g3390 [Ancylostoma ceylanicum]|uniref:CCHC-type domain-containing protein n=1 Tax=Ancylostoma ceylanicum TaxID=53326 RepID=A0A016WRW4_9BILA|nr:hypothetical protein Y032_0557g3390 [Ancylostoma ceylanicum]